MDGDLARKATAEAVATGLLVAIVVGSARGTRTGGWTTRPGRASRPSASFGTKFERHGRALLVSLDISTS
jgi:hypothetical protein